LFAFIRFAGPERHPFVSMTSRNVGRALKAIDGEAIAAAGKFQIIHQSNSGSVDSLTAMM
jgi:hypothetical protein